MPIKLIQPRKKKKDAKRHPIKKVIPKQFLLMDPPVIARDPKPLAGLMDFQCKGIRGPVWKERFLVCAKGKLAWYPPECAVQGYVESEALGSIPIANIFVSSVDADGFLLDLETERTAYHFRSQQKNDVGKWQDAIMNTSPPGAMQHLMQQPKIKEGIYKGKNFWANVGADTSTSKTGGIPFGLRAELVTKEQDALLRNIFDLIKAQDTLNVNKEIIEDSDLAKFVDNRLSNNASLKDKVPSMENCIDAIEEAIVLGNDTEKDCTFEAFKAAICATRTSDNPNGSEMARIIELAMQGKTSIEKTADEAGEMSVGQKLYEYHKFMGNVLGGCREGEIDKSNDKITLTKVVAESYLNNIVREVEMLIERHKQYQERLHTLDPTLRSRVQHRAVDDVFDNEMLPGERWVRP